MYTDDSRFTHRYSVAIGIVVVMAVLVGLLAVQPRRVARAAGECYIKAASPQAILTSNQNLLHYSTVINLDRTEAITITDVSIVGQTTGTINTSYAFTATVAPTSATIPITYVWRATNQTMVTHTGELTDVTTFIWNAAGTKMIAVTASNNEEGTVTGTYVVAITPYMQQVQN